MRQLSVFITALAMFAVVMSANIAPAGKGLACVSQAWAADDAGMEKVTLLLKKLRTSMASMKDLDELQKSGMPAKDVDRMRRAMEQKIQTLTNQTVESIHAL